MVVHGIDKDGNRVEIEVCPKCIEKPSKKPNTIGKSLDKYGMEVLEK